GRFEQSLGPHLLRFEVQRRTQSQDGLGVGGFDLPQRAYSADRTEQFLRASDTGTFGRHFTTEARLQFHFLNTSSLPATDQPAILVLGAFDAGGAQVGGGEHDYELELSEDLGYLHGKHSFRVGGLLEGGHYRSDQENNTGGTFTFPDLAAYQAGRPTSFTQVF